MKPLKSLRIAPGRPAICPDDGRVITFRERCPFCGGEVLLPGGMAKQILRLPFLRTIRAVKNDATQRLTNGGPAARRG